MSPSRPAPSFGAPKSIRPADPEKEAKLDEIAQRAEARGNGVAGQPVPVPSTTQTSEMDVRKQTSDKAIVKRRGGRKRRRRTIYLPLDVDTALEQFCEVSGREVSETVAAAVELYLASKR